MTASVDELCAAAIRALTGERGLHFRGRRLYRGRHRLPHFAAHLQPQADDDLGSLRGAADAHALRLLHSDAALHAWLMPRPAVERAVFELIEQLRAESLAAAALPGVRRNLRRRFEQWSLACHRSGLTESASGVLLYTLAQVCRSRLSGEPVVEQTEDWIETTRGELVPSIGRHLAGLRRDRHDQAACAVHALAIARHVGGLLDGTGGGAADDDAVLSAAERAAWGLALPPEPGDGDDGGTAADGGRRALADDAPPYRVFTTAWDREEPATRLLRRERLLELRAQLDGLVARQGFNLARLARDLKVLLARPLPDGWEDGHESGRIDGRRLAQLISTPGERRLFRADRERPQADCAVCFLLDCSGSMKAHAEPVATLVDLYVRALEMAGARCEVLGYGTAAWNGGRALRDWQRAGRPPAPGRLNERLHLVLKDADTPWRRTRAGIAALLEPTLFREGLDGEAVDWAATRLRARPEARRLLVVVCDGCPMDSATQLANGPDCLDLHLREVVWRQEADGALAIHGLGVGLDLSPYYRRACLLDLASAGVAEAARALLRQLARG